MYTMPATNPYDEAVSASGLIEAYEDNVYLGAQVQGLVKGVYAHVGDQVEAGKLLVEVDDRLQKAQVEIAQTSIEVARAKLEKNLSQLERLTSVKDIRAISQEDLKNKENDVLIAENELKNAVAMLKDAEASLEQTKIFAPKDATVLKLDFRAGEFVGNQERTSMTPNNALLVLGNCTKLQVRVDVDEHNAFRIRPRQSATAYIKGAAEVAIPLTFVRFEPYCIPKKSLTSAADERVDTRVLQVIYSFDTVPDFPTYVGQQVDVFIDAPRIFRQEDARDKALEYGIDLKS
jgi:RND family efflux transporter MFP subunit